MKFRWEKKYLYWGLTAFAVIAASIVFYLTIDKITVVWAYVKKLMDILTPFTLGFVFAYLMDPVMDFFERLLLLGLNKTKLKKKERIARYIAITITLIVVALLLAGFLLMIIPELGRSIKSIVNNLSIYLMNLEKWIFSVLNSTQIENFLTTEFDSLNTSITKWASEQA